MGKIFETTINNFTGGIVNDPRDKRTNVARMVTNFNIADTTRLIPYRSSEDGDSGSTTSEKQNFAIGLWTPTSEYRLFSLGVVSGSGKAEVLMKLLGDITNNIWNTPANNQSSTGTTNFFLFVYYKRTGKFYGARSGTHIWAFTPDGSTSFANTHRAITYANIAQGLVHSKDDNLYIPYDNKIAKNDNGSWTDAVVTLPEEFKINSICEFGNYLAIGASPVSGFGNSRVYLWNRDDSLETLSESIDWGSGELTILEEVNGYLIGISARRGTIVDLDDRIIFRYLLGNRSLKFDELIDTTSGSLLPIAKQKLDNRVYFLMKTVVDGVIREGLWSFGRSLFQDNFTIVHERTPDNNTALGSGVIRGFFKIGDYTFISHTDNNGDYQLSKTNDQAIYTATSIWESVIFGTSSPSLKKDLIGTTVTSSPLPSAGQVVLKYKIDAESSYTTIFTEATDNSISFSAVTSLPKDYKEIQFRIESIGGAEITGLSFKEEVTGKRNYD